MGEGCFCLYVYSRPRWLEDDANCDIHQAMRKACPSGANTATLTNPTAPTTTRILAAVRSKWTTSVPGLAALSASAQ